MRRGQFSGLAAGRLALWLTLALTLFFAARAQQPPALASVRIAHMSPDAPLIDALVGRGIHLRDMAFGDVSPYLALAAGDYEIQVFPHRLPLQREAEMQGGDAGEGESQETPEQAAPSLALEPVTILATLEPGAYYTVLLSGFYEPPAEGRELGALSIAVDPEDTRLAITGPRGYQAELTGELLRDNLQPGPYTIVASREGYQTAQYEAELQPNTTTVLSITLQEGQDDQATPEADIQQITRDTQWQGLELHVYQDELAAFPPAGQTLVRLIHASPVSPALDVQAVPGTGLDQPDDPGTGEPAGLAENLAFPNDSDYVALAGSSYRLELRAYGNRSLLADSPLTLEPGGVYTLFLVGDPADSYLSVVPSVDALVTP